MAAGQTVPRLAMQGSDKGGDWEGVCGEKNRVQRGGGGCVRGLCAEEKVREDGGEFVGENGGEDGYEESCGDSGGGLPVVQGAGDGPVRDDVLADGHDCSPDAFALRGGARRAPILFNGLTSSRADGLVISTMLPSFIDIDAVEARVSSLSKQQLLTLAPMGGGVAYVVSVFWALGYLLRSLRAASATMIDLEKETCDSSGKGPQRFGSRR